MKITTARSCPSLPVCACRALVLILGLASALLLAQDQPLAAPPSPVAAAGLTDAQKAMLQGKMGDMVQVLASAGGIKLVPIPAGSFLMGSPADEAGRKDNEGPQTQVTFTKGFFIGSTDVTQDLYEAVVGSNPSYFKKPKSPVERISWEDAMAFCQKLTEREQAAGRLPAALAFTLPTEAQWEYACRAGTTGRFAGDFDAMAWYIKNCDSTTHPVAQKKPNAWGLYDMHGNVAEWCLDWYDAKLPGGAATDPTGPAAGTGRVTRGGGWWLFSGDCRSASRSHFPQDDRDHDVGLRLVLSENK